MSQKPLEPRRTENGVVIHELSLYDGDAALAYGTRLWNGGLALAKFVAWRRSPVRSRIALELGAGTGVVGLTLGKLGARVTITDCEPSVLSLIDRNIQANALGTHVSLRRLDFGDASTYLEPSAFDLVVAADVLYEDDHAQQLALALQAHMPAGAGAEALLAAAHRPEDTPGFFEAAYGLGFRVERLEDGSGHVVGCAKGHAAEVYAGSRFVVLHPGRAADAIRQAVPCPGMPIIQIFRLTRPLLAVLGQPSESMQAEAEAQDAAGPPTWVVVGGRGAGGASPNPASAWHETRAAAHVAGSGALGDWGPSRGGGACGWPALVPQARWPRP